jgi:uncharacterized RDD family membrane protein YckC
MDPQRNTENAYDCHDKLGIYPIGNLPIYSQAKKTKYPLSISPGGIALNQETNHQADNGAGMINAGFFRRLASILYDLLLLLALMALATTAITLPLGMPEGHWLILFQILVFELIPLLFFTGFWSRGGQTLGMRAWRIKLVRQDGGEIGWNDAFRRHLAGLLSCLSLGIGFLWVLIDRDGLAWHDRLSRTRLIRS